MGGHVVDGEVVDWEHVPEEAVTALEEFDVSPKAVRRSNALSREE